jgi:DNA-binding NarL/FixJ family response regulator
MEALRLHRQGQSFESKAGIAPCVPDVRFAPESGHSAVAVRCPLSANIRSRSTAAALTTLTQAKETIVSAFVRLREKTSAAVGSIFRSINLQRHDLPATGRNALPLDKLTPRERAVLEGIVEGLDNSEIAASLELSEKTVRNHITRVFDKIGVEHRYQAIVRAREAGLGMKSRLTSQS